MAYPGKMEDLPIKWRKFMSKIFDLIFAHPKSPNKQIYNAPQDTPFTSGTLCTIPLIATKYFLFR